MKFFIKKLITLIITLLVISFLTFTAFSVIPGDAALSRLGKDATEEQLERARDEMGLNDPLLELAVILLVRVCDAGGFRGVLPV